MPAPPVEYVLLDAQPDAPRRRRLLGARAGRCSPGRSRGTGTWSSSVSISPPSSARRRPAASSHLCSGHPTAPAAGRLAGDLLRELPRSPRGQGSNEWAIAGSRTASGRPLLANDPHLLVQQPGAWIELHLRAPGYEARGVAAPFAPGIVLGTTAHHAWGATNVCGDVQDLYLERLNDEGTAARYEDAWEPLTIHREEIRVRGSDEPIVHEVRATRHGPILDSYLTGRLRPAKHPLDGDVRAPLGRRRAQHPPVRADRRRERHDLRGVPGGRARARVSRPEPRLRRRRRHDRLSVHRPAPDPPGRRRHGPGPRMDGRARVGRASSRSRSCRSRSTPTAGYLVTANDRIHDDGYPHVIGADFHAPDRAARITELLEERTRPHGRDVPADPGRHRLGLGAIAPPTDVDRGRRARALFDGWDHDLDARVRRRPRSGRSSSTSSRDEHRAAREPLIEEYLTDRELFRCRALPSAPRRGHPHGAAVRRRARRRVGPLRRRDGARPRRLALG